jgi:hypothetical protein
MSINIISGVAKAVKCRGNAFDEKEQCKTDPISFDCLADTVALVNDTKTCYNIPSLRKALYRSNGRDPTSRKFLENWEEVLFVDRNDALRFLIRQVMHEFKLKMKDEADEIIRQAENDPGTEVVLDPFVQVKIPNVLFPPQYQFYLEEESHDVEINFAWLNDMYVLQVCSYEGTPINLFSAYYQTTDDLRRVAFLVPDDFVKSIADTIQTYFTSASFDEDHTLE